MVQHLIDQTAKGPLAENEDWWNLNVDDETGALTVIHEWDHMNPYTSTVTSKGAKQWTVDDFMTSDEPGYLKQKLATLLQEHGYTD